MSRMGNPEESQRPRLLRSPGTRSPPPSGRTVSTRNTEGEDGEAAGAGHGTSQEDLHGRDDKEDHRPPPGPRVGAGGQGE